MREPFVRAVAGLAALVAAAVQIPAVAATVMIDKTVPVAGAKMLQLETGGADVVLLPVESPASSVHVVAEQNGPAPTPALESSHGANRLVLRISAAAKSLVPFAASSSMTYTVTYPARMRVDLRATSGNVQLTAPSAAVGIYDQNGNITISGPRAAVTVENAHGSIVVTHASGSIDLAADLGNVTADLAPGWSAGEVRMQSGTGDLRLAVPAGLRAHVDVSTGGGGTAHNDFGNSTASKPLVFLYAANGNAWLTVQH